MVKDAVASYLQKRAALARRPLVCPNTRGIQQVVVIPALAESKNLFQTLDDLAANPKAETERTLVICVVNNRRPGVAAEEDIRDNALTLERLRSYAGGLRLGYVDAATPGHELDDKEGVGSARKIGLDWGLHVIYEEGLVDAPLISLDGDSRVDSNYLAAIRVAFEAPQAWAAVVEYAHPLDGEESEVRAILCYELFLRYHELGLRHAASPYAFPTIGSTIACNGRAYAAVSGMNRRQAGEDFYFLQQLAKTGHVDRIAGTVVQPAARPSHRVPFGTGRRVRRFLEGVEEEYRVYHPESYDILKAWLETVKSGHDLDGAGLLRKAKGVAPELAEFLKAQRFEEAWPRLTANAKDTKQLLRQFHCWFDGFRTLKLMHYLRDHGYPDQETFGAVGELLERMGVKPSIPPLAALRHNIEGQKGLLAQLRRKNGDSNHLC